MWPATGDVWLPRGIIAVEIVSVVLRVLKPQKLSTCLPPFLRYSLPEKVGAATKHGDLR